MQAPLYGYIAALAKLRREHRVLSRGRPTVLYGIQAGPGALAYRMDSDEGSLLVVFNSADAPTLVDNLELGLPPGTPLPLLFSIDEGGDANIGADGRLSMALPARAGRVYALPRAPTSTPKPLPRAIVMPSSYRNYGKDGDGDGKRDLITEPRDAFASIANYFVGYGWKTGTPVFVPAMAQPDAQAFVPENFEAKYSLADLAAKGFKPSGAGAPDLPATLLTLEGANGPEYWIGYQNFYVITRYNRSPMAHSRKARSTILQG